MVKQHFYDWRPITLNTANGYLTFAGSTSTLSAYVALVFLKILK